VAKSLDRLPYVTFDCADPSLSSKLRKPSEWCWTDYFDYKEHPTKPLPMVGDFVQLGGSIHPDEKILDSDPMVLRSFFTQNCAVNDRVKLFVSEAKPGTIGPKTLGVHFRAGDMRRYAFHPTPPTEALMNSVISQELASGKYDQIYIATESKKFVRRAKKTFGSKVPVLHGYSSWSVEAKNVNDLNNLKVIADAHYLSSCSTIVHSRSNVAWASFIFSEGNLVKSIEIDLGVNPSFAPWAVVKGALFFYIFASKREKHARFINRNVSQQN
jgi:hypothetical protein